MSLLKINRFFGILLLGLLVGSCGINANMMFKTPKDGSFKYDSIPMRPIEDYRIAVDDKLSFVLTTNNGKRIIEQLSGTSIEGNISSGNGTISTSANGRRWDEFIVLRDGTVKLPLLGNVFVEGLTISQCQDTLEKYFESQYQDPFLQVRITNQRCIVFNGNGNDASIVEIQNNNTTLMEVIAMTGGIPERGRSRAIKVMRKVNDKREIYLIDISTIEGLKYADMIIQGNDYIYVEPDPQIIEGVLKEAAPVSSLISSIFMFYVLLTKF